MKTRLLSRISFLLAVVFLCTAFLPLPASALPNGSLLSLRYDTLLANRTIEVMVELEDNADTDEVWQQILALDTAAEWLCSYHTVMKGFALRINSVCTGMLRTIPGVLDVYASRVFSCEEESSADREIPLTEDIFPSADAELPANSDSPSETDASEASENTGHALPVSLPAAADAGTSESRTVVSANTPSAAVPTAAETHDFGYRGEGMIVAVLDSSFDCSHPCFALTDENTAALSRADIDAMLKKGLKVSNYYMNTPEESPYYSAKIPFCHDYVDFDNDVSDSGSHGTHVAAIIAANSINDKKLGFDGIAPEAQLLLMKVGPDDTSTIFEYAILNALDDAISLGADVINMSFGLSGGFTDRSLSTYNYYKLTEKALELGIILAAAGGNPGNPGKGSNYASLYDIEQYPTYLPDYGQISEPASFSTSLAVAGAVPVNTVTGEYIDYQGAPILYLLSTENLSQSLLKPGQYTIARIPGYGAEDDYRKLDVKGKAVVVSRGVISFAEKAAAAQKAGAALLIVYNNNPDELSLVNMAVGADCAIPAAFISSADGALLKHGAVLTFKSGEKMVFHTEETVTVADYSARGVTPDLHLKPDLTAYGTHIYSALNGGGYGTMSGTSMATPYIAGAAALLLQKLDYGKVIPDTSYIQTLLMNAAEPLRAPGGIEYSPRAQGAGLCDIEGALSASFTVTDANGKPKVELGGSLGRQFGFDIVITNHSGKDAAYNISATLQYDAYESKLLGEGESEYFMTGESKAETDAILRVGDSLNINAYAASPQTRRIVVKAGKSVRLRMDISFSDDAYNRLKKIYENGFFAEGYVFVKKVSDGSVMSIPYMGFCGDWDKLPAFEGEPGSTRSFASQSAISYVRIDGKSMPYYAGSNAFLPDDAVNPEAIMISPNGDGCADFIGFELHPLRALSGLITRIYASDGELLFEENYTAYMSRSLYNSETEKLTSYFFDYVWNGSDLYNHFYIMPNGSYTVKICGKTLSGKETAVWSAPVIIDTVRPVIQQCRTRREKSSSFLDLTISDNQALQFILLYAPDGTEIFRYAPSSADMLTAWNASIDITEAAAAYEYLYMDVADFAFNIVTDKIPLGGGA